MSSETEICNIALGNVGVSHEIGALDEGSTESDQCERYYTHARNEALRELAPDFAKGYVTLGLVDEEPNDDWGYAYRYPSDCLKALRIVNGDRNGIGRIPFAISHDAQGKLILTDEPDAVLHYVKLVTNTELFDTSFVNGVAANLGRYIAVPLSRSAAEIKRAADAWKDAKATAQKENAAEAGAEAPREAESVRVRE